MIDPREIFEHPEMHVAYMTGSSEAGSNPEGQYFDRKEVRGGDLKKERKNILETVSAFTNARGGVLVLGISDEGEMKGLGHLQEAEYNSLVQNLNEQLINHQARSKEWIHGGVKFLLIYAPEGSSGICETASSEPRGWKREAANNLKLTPHDRERLIIERSQRFERLAVCDYDPNLVHPAVYAQFRRLYIAEREANYQDSQEEFLLNVGAIRQEGNRLQFTHAGYLFFAQNPRNQLPAAYVRLLKYESEVQDYENPGMATFDRDLDGCLPELLRKVRGFVNDSPYFRRYSYRDPLGSGIKEESEYPLSAVEEAIVNAMIHRDYHSDQPLVCSAYRDAFVVRSPGRIQQESFIPTAFSLGGSVRLRPFRRNPQLVDWARLMRDESGQRFVRSLAEGTRTMLDSMQKMGLPAPAYKTNGYTQVTFENLYREREARYRGTSQAAGPEFTNLYPVHIASSLDKELEESVWDLRGQVMSLLKNKFQNTGWFLDRAGYSRITVHQKGHHTKLPGEVNNWMQIYPGFTLQLHVISERLFLSVDYNIQVKNVARLSALHQQGISDLRHRWAQVKIGGVWLEGKIEDFSDYYARIFVTELEKEEHVPLAEVIPSLRLSEIKAVLAQAGTSFPLEQKVKELSLSNQVNASRSRAEQIKAFVPVLAKEIFPLTYNGYRAQMGENPVALPKGNPFIDSGVVQPFTLSELSEPAVKFNDNHASQKISEGLIKFGSVQTGKKDLELVPLVLTGWEQGMEGLLRRLTQGSELFKGMERTFATRLTYLSLISKPRAEDFLPEVQRLLAQYPRWCGNAHLDRAFLIHLPEDQYGVSEISSPYYALKEYLLAEGIPVQMVDTPTLLNPKYKDLNLALNLIAKTGGTPWVLPDKLPEADLFIGLSYTQYKSETQLYRTMGYANVFNEYGQWQYFRGNAEAFPYDQKHEYFFQLVKDTLSHLEANLPASPILHVHYSAKFSREDREEILRAVQTIRPRAKVVFVWINTGHNIRMFDSRLEGNGSLARGAYVETSPHQFYLSTTGYTTLRNILGSPQMLEVNVRMEPYQEGQYFPIGNVAQHILALTKLNWASSQSVNGEPVTIKYARDVARLSQVFLRRKGIFRLHPVLEKTPWFL